ncbi:hypothetical protein CUROG_09365 [Corynebacterium urogenitale]|uniref:DUF2505 domain-containing protein n=1 Tax=Corynebacterium urogenitale TaxID=2487892 RepID=A0A5J6ZCB5_9CORY|nr:DUF2505 domain-containing protein [Corynebacterium urogenitale]QFQ03217.1 hypothetical protein CUROG_09365 [Corynebacterium urogenitale]
MTTHSENTAAINFPIDKVHEALSNKAYWEYEAAHINDEPGEVNEFSAEPIKAVLFELLPKAALPEAVRGMVSQDLKLKRVVEFGPVAGDVSTGTVHAEVKGAPVKFDAEAKLTGQGDKTELFADVAVEVAIPMMGAVLEPKVAEWVEEFLTREASLIEKFISDNQ